MLHRTLALLSLLSVGCASSRTEAFHVGASPEPVAPTPYAAAAATDAPEPTASERFLSEPGTPPPAFVLPPPADEGLRHSRFTLKGGYYGSEADELDSGWIVNLSWMRFFTSLFALELEVGYFDASGDDGGLSTDAWGIPLMVNGRLNLPVWVLDLYGGLGVGTIYYDIESRAGSLSSSDDGFVLAGNVFLGATINVADSIALGLEGKYYLTEDVADSDSGLDALALMLTVGFSR